MKVAFIYGKQPSSTLTWLGTGSTCYHVAFTDGYHLWDMHWIRRRRLWKGLYPASHVVLVDAPVEITAKYLDHKLDTDRAVYGWVDYVRFGFRWAYHLVGKSTPNAGGTICSELVADDLIKNGWKQRFAEVPSPADLEEVLLGRRNAIEFAGEAA